MNIYQKLIEVRKTVPYLQKADTGSQYNYTGSSRVLAAVKEKMDELGLLLIPSVTGHKLSESPIDFKDANGNVTKRTTTYFTELEMTMTWVNAEKPDEQIVSSWYGQGVDIAGEKGVGKALTYAEKYFMLKFFNIATDKDDPDAFQAKHELKEPAPETPTTSQTPSQQIKNTPPPKAPQTSVANLISEAQANYAQKLKKEKRIEENDFRRMVAEYSEGNMDVYQLNKKQASEFINFLNNYGAVGV
jgi:hypothetical protein